MVESHQGRYRLLERLPDCGGLPRHRVTGVTLAASAEAGVVGGVRSWTGLAETAWLRATLREGHPAVARAALLGVEQAGDALLVVHAPLADPAWTDAAAALPADRLVREAARLAAWLRDGLARRAGCGNLRLSALRLGAAGPAASPVAWAAPPACLVHRGRLEPELRALAVGGDEDEPRLDVALLAGDLAHWLGEQIRSRRAVVSADERARLGALREACAACAASARAGVSAARLEPLLAALAAEGSAPRRRVSAADRHGDSGAAVAAAAVRDLAGGGDRAWLALTGVATSPERVLTAMAAVVPPGAELACARGLDLQPVVAVGKRAGRERPESWLLLVDEEPAPPLAAVAWLARTREHRARVLVLAGRPDSPGLRLLAPEFGPLWDLAVRSGGAVGEAADDGPAAARAEVPVASGAPDADERAVLGLVAFAGSALPLELATRSAGLTPAAVGRAAAGLVARGDAVWCGARGGWGRTGAQAALRVTPAGARTATTWFGEVAERRACRDLLARQVPAGARADRCWLRFHLRWSAGDAAGAARELSTLLASDPGPEVDAALAAACRHALAPDAPVDLPVRFRLAACLRLGRLCQRRGLLDEAADVFGRGLAIATGPSASADEDLGDTLAELAFAQADLLDKRGEFAALDALLAQVTAAVAERLAPPARDRLRYERAWAHHRLGRHEEALEICHALLRHLDPDAQPRETADIYNLIGLVRYESSRYEEARIDIQRGLVLRERVGDQAAVARSCNNLGMILLALGDLARAEESLRRSLSIKTRAGDRPGIASSLLNLAYIALCREQLDLARARGEEALAIAREHGLRQLTAEVLLLLGEVAEAQGRRDDAAAGYASARELAALIGDADQHLAALRSEAALALRQGDPARAWAVFRVAERVAADVPSQLQRARLRELAGDLLAADGRAAAAADAYEEAASALHALHKPDLLARARARAALARVRAGQPERARELYGELRAGATDVRVGALPAEFRELELVLGPGAAGGAPAPGGGGELLRALLALPSLGAQGLAFDAHVRRAVDLLHASGVFSWLGVSLVAPTGEERGRWESGASPPAGDTTVAVRDVWPDGSEVLATASLGEGAWTGIDPDTGREALALVLSSLARHRARVEPGRLAREARPAPAEAGARPGGTALLGHSPPLAAVRRFVEKVAPLEANVLILGENGSGKELVARLIHERGPRAGEPYLAVNCASLPPSLIESELFGHERGAFTDARARHAGVFERAGAGTILLDEIGELPLALQSKLLRVLQEKEFVRVGGGDRLPLRARVLAATNCDLERAVVAGAFREDLYWRLAVLPVRMPPLRERPEDIPLLLRHFLEVYAAEFGVPVCEVEPEALAALTAADWPGNVRQLQNLARRLLIFAEGRPIRRGDLPGDLMGAARGGAEPREGTPGLEVAIGRLLDDAGDAGPPLVPRLQGLLARLMCERCGGNKARAARRLGITAPTLYAWLRRERG